MSEIETILDSYKSICAVCEEKESSCEKCCCGIQIRALEKRIPKKVTDFACPNCKNGILTDDLGDSFKYCPSCGQKLLWGGDVE